MIWATLLGLWYVWCVVSLALACRKLMAKRGELQAVLAPHDPRTGSGKAVQRGR